MSHVTLTQTSPRVATLTLRRTDNERNQINPAVMDDLESQARAAGLLPLRALIVLSGYEKLFSTGAAIEDLGHSDAAQALEFSRRGKQVFGLLQQLPCITICCINGFALGGGLELALHCDFRIASANARMGLPEINLGIIPGWGGTRLLPALVGHSRALRMIASGDPVNAETALAWELVDDVVPTTGDLLFAAEKLAARFTDKPRGALAMAKRALQYPFVGNESAIHQVEQPVFPEIESKAFGDLWDSAERAEGIAALIAKRRPVWPD